MLVNNTHIHMNWGEYAICHRKRKEKLVIESYTHKNVGFFTSHTLLV